MFASATISHYDSDMYEALKQPSFNELYQQLCALPDNMIGEIIAGELVVSPRPAVRHAAAGTGIGSDMWSRFHRKPGGTDAPGGWWILVEPELHLGAEALVPDIAGWKRETLPELPDTTALSVAPDWICEILSPGTARRDKKEKARSYHAAGVTWYWLVDPIERTLEAYRRAGEFWVRLGVWTDDEKARIEPFDAVELELERWWEGFKRRKV